LPVTPCVVADLGGTFLRCAIVVGDAIGNLERIRLPGSADSGRETIWPDIVEIIGAYVARHAEDISPASSIAFAFPGPIVDGGIPASAPTVLGGNGSIPDVRALLSYRTRRDVVILNDVSAGAWYFSQRAPANRFVVVTISSGIGAKIFDRRHPLGVLDDVPSAGEIGHLVVDDDRAAPLCDCGGRGHLGAIASARGFERAVRIAALSDGPGFGRSLNVTRFGATAQKLTNEAHLVPALQAGDPWTVALLRSAVRPLAGVLRTLCVANGLDAIMLMGGFAQALGETYRSLVANAVGSLSDAGPARRDFTHRVFLAAAGEEPSLVGAAAYERMSRLVS
jgi:predicted NBD/HSP70 family sugar kinase